MRLIAAGAVLLGAANLTGGVWALAAPRSFYDVIATYPPYNEHLIHDIGAFTIALGLAPLLGLWLRSALVTGLVTYAVGAAVHALSHLVDAGQGGHGSDPVLYSAIAVVSVAVAALAVRQRPRGGVASQVR